MTDSALFKVVWNRGIERLRQKGDQSGPNQKPASYQVRTISMMYSVQRCFD